MNAPTPLTAERLEQLAYEFALEYHSPDDLAVRFSLPPAVVTQIYDEPRFKALVLEQRRQIDETGDQTRLVARKMVAELVPVIAAMVASESVDGKDRIAGFKALKEVAGISDGAGAAAGGGFAIQININ